MSDAPETPDGAEPEELPEPDRRLLEAHDLALAALHEITPPSTVGAPAGHLVEPGGVVSLRFENALPGYPGWFWTVSVAVVEGSEPTVLEAELLPGDDALLAPEWVPWAVRLKEYQAAQAMIAVEAAALTAERGDDDFDDEDEDADVDEGDEDFDEDGSSILHAGDVDGVDIDALDGDSDDEADELDDVDEELEDDDEADVDEELDDEDDLDR